MIMSDGQGTTEPLIDYFLMHNVVDVTLMEARCNDWF